MLIRAKIVLNIVTSTLFQTIQMQENKGKESQHCFYQSSTYRRDKEYVLTKNKESRKH